MEGEEEKRPYKIKDVTRQIKKSVVAASFEDLLKRSSEKFGKNEMPRIHLDSDGTEIDDEDYFQTLEPNTELIVVFNGEQWIDPTQQFVTITSHSNADAIDSGGVVGERTHLKKLVGQMKTNAVILSDNDLELLSNMDMDNFADLIGEDFVEQLKEIKENSGRILCEKRDAFENYELLKMMRSAKQSNNENKANWSFCPSESESTTSLSTMSSFSSNIQQ